MFAREPEIFLIRATIGPQQQNVDRTICCVMVKLRLDHVGTRRTVQDRTETSCLGPQQSYVQ